MSDAWLRPVTTLQHVADAANVHRSTASRALHPATARLISAPVVARVVAVASRLGYRRDLLAAGLHTNRSRLVGVLIPDIANPVFIPILAGIEAALADAGYATLVANAHHGSDGALSLVGELAMRRVDGLILATARQDDPVVARCIALGLPAVLAYRSDPEHRLPAVTSDDQAGLALAVQYLAGLGHRLIGHLGGPGTVSTGMQRAAGFQAAMRALKLKPGPHVEASVYTRDAGRAAARILLAKYPLLTAIAAANDLLALGVYQALEERGLRCPDDVSVIGYNDMPLMDMIDPPLTTIRIEHELLGREAARLLLDRMASGKPGKPAAPRMILLPPSLVVRGSTGKPRR